MIACRLGVISAVGMVAAMAMAPPLRAADNWVATKSLANGINRNCGDAPWSDYRIEIRGNVLTGAPTNPSQKDLPIRVDLQSLQPNGSGRVTFMPPSGIGPVQFDFEPGSGPRKITYGRVNLECRWLLQPKGHYILDGTEAISRMAPCSTSPPRSTPTKPPPGST